MQGGVLGHAEHLKGEFGRVNICNHLQPSKISGPMCEVLYMCVTNSSGRE